MPFGSRRTLRAMDSDVQDVLTGENLRELKYWEDAMHRAVQMEPASVLDLTMQARQRASDADLPSNILNMGRTDLAWAGPSADGLSIAGRVQLTLKGERGLKIVANVSSRDINAAFVAATGTDPNGTTPSGAIHYDGRIIKRATPVVREDAADDEECTR